MLTAESILKIERESIERFVLSCHHLYRGRILDLGCGKQPYRQLILDHIDGDGEYVPYDRADFPANVSGHDVGDDPFDRPRSFDVVLVTQLLQYQRDQVEFLRDVRFLLRPGGHLVISGATNWRVIEPADKFRCTPAGVRELLEDAGFQVERVDVRAAVEVAPGFEMPLGWGAVARSPET